MARLRQVTKDEVTDPLTREMYERLFGDRDPVTDPGSTDGTPGDWWTVYALVPDVLRHVVDGYHLYSSPDRSLDPVLRELVQTRAGWAVGSQFVFSQHAKALRALGVSGDKVDAVAGWQVSELFGPVERAVLAFTDGIALAQGRVPDAVVDTLRAALTDEAVLELAYFAGYYSMHAAVTKALRLEFDDRDEPVIEVLPERAVP